MVSLTGQPGIGPKQPKAAKGPRKPIPRQSAKRATETFPLRENAEDHDCTLRLPGCRHDKAYTVFAHFRRFGWAGMGQKPHDLLGCFACDICHALQEARDPICTDTDLLRAMGETLQIQWRDGIIGLVTRDDAG